MLKVTYTISPGYCDVTLSPATPPLHITHTTEEYFARLEDIRHACKLIIQTTRPPRITGFLENINSLNPVHQAYVLMVEKVERMRLLDVLSCLEHGLDFNASLEHSKIYSYPQRRLYRNELPPRYSYYESALQKGTMNPNILSTGKCPYVFPSIL